MRPWQIVCLVLICGSILVFSVVVLKSDTGEVAKDQRAVERVLIEKRIVTKGKDGVRGGRGPVGKRGRPGRDGRDGKSIRGRRGRAGRDGKDGRPGRPGRDGADGRSITLADLEKYCDTHVCHGPAGADGRDGVDGRDAPPPTQAQIDAAVTAYCDAHSACTPPLPPPSVPCAMQDPALGYVCAPPPIP